jgi:hypothetical protein
MTFRKLDSYPSSGVGVGHTQLDSAERANLNVVLSIITDDAQSAETQKSRRMAADVADAFSIIWVIFSSFVVVMQTRLRNDFQCFSEPLTRQVAVHFGRTDH